MTRTGQETGPFFWLLQRQSGAFTALRRSGLMPNHQRNQTHHYETAQRTGQDELPTYPFAAANEFVVMVIAIALGVNVPHQPHLLARLTVGREKSAAIHVLIE